MLFYFVQTADGATARAIRQHVPGLRQRNFVCTHFKQELLYLTGLLSPFAIMFGYLDPQGMNLFFRGPKKITYTQGSYQE